MVLRSLTKGKKRAVEEIDDTETLSSLSPAPPERPSVKKPKRAETRKCPVCEEAIPIRLLGRHAELELERVEEILRGVGSSSDTVDILDEGSSSRRSALKARKSLTALTITPRTSLPNDSLATTLKTLRSITTHRKKRHAKLREMTRESETDGLAASSSNGGYLRATAGRGEGLCPVCLKMVKGDVDVVEAHVDSCLAHASRVVEERERLEREREEREREDVDLDIWEDVDIDGVETRLRVTDGVSLRGTGIHVRDHNQVDVDEEIDVDGDDEAVFGDAQFTEGDLLAPGAPEPHQLSPEQEPGTQIDGVGENQDDGETDNQTLRALVAEGKIVRRDGEALGGVEGLKVKMEEVLGVGETDKMDLAIVAARHAGDTLALVGALENKIKQLESMRVSSSTSLLCRICLEPYTEPTVSTGCWHTCCRECWLRCLGSTKLCPMCKRITGATELRRVYL
ncbi:hypothetical protein JAAARDRAFT_28057 [Jaapia argillacea MUCL 33604]|uniref:RING-type domain-containing protein n=1 Tax=Jaapia argillacea MUCL 33604 TaxID=933084 RepID=A0A067QLR1_9AGAM|nr:hypothetical protein JAAARDRAFT_28057 [Jaapia argillacea MUCL 33604]